MIIGIGTDLIEIQRIEKTLKKFPTRFSTRIFTSCEQKYAWTSKYPAATFAKRFAAKEAFSKALGTGFQNGVSWREIEVINNSQGQPELNIYGNALQYLHQKFGEGPYKFHLSLSDTKLLAQAFVVICKEDSHD